MDAEEIPGGYRIPSSEEQRSESTEQLQPARTVAICAVYTILENELYVSSPCFRMVGGICKNKNIISLPLYRIIDLFVFSIISLYRMIIFIIFHFSYEDLTMTHTKV